MTLPVCDVCGVEYVEGYEGPCQEYGNGLTDEQFARAIENGHKLRTCPGAVSLTATLQRRIERAEQHAEVLAKALDEFFNDGRMHYVRAADLNQAVRPTLRALGYSKEETS